MIDSPCSPRFDTQQHPCNCIGDISGMAKMVAAIDVKKAAAVDPLEEPQNVAVARPINELRPHNNYRKTSPGKIESDFLGGGLRSFVRIARRRWEIFGSGLVADWSENR